MFADNILFPTGLIFSILHLKKIHLLKQSIIRFIDFFYPLLSWLMPIKTFRYGFTGGSNAFLNLVIFFLCNKYVYDQGMLHFAGIAVNSYIAADLTAMCISFPIGFLLNKYIVFENTTGRSGRQLSLYAGLTLTNIALHYILLRLFVGYLGYWATPSEALIIILLAGISYLFQTYVTFRQETIVK